MSIIIIDVLYGLTAAAMGAVVAWFLCWSYCQRRAYREINAEARYTAEILVRLQELATRVAVDVDEHSDRVEEMNIKLCSAENQKPDVIVEVVAKLIQANQEMQKKLASTEDKIRQQAQEMEIHATEARTDALTLLANRRAFDDELVRRVAEFRRLGQSFSMIMADVDHFKKFNDKHGHQAGDEVLQGIAKLLRRMMREMDLVARFGGEEFAIILPGTNLKDASQVALRACETIEKVHFCRDLKNKLQVTVSFGVAEVQTNEEGAALVMRADKALYASKEDGRNCVYWHDGGAVHRLDPNKYPLLTENMEQQPVTVAADQEKVHKPAVVPEDNTTQPKPDPAHAGALDMVSNLASRTNFCQHVRNRTAEWKRGGPTFSVVLIEVNPSDQSAEHINMHAREFATVAAAKFIVAAVREMDIVGHYAPGCFALLLPAAGLADAIRTAERFREGFPQHCLSAHGKHPGLKLSIGAVQVMETDDSISLLKRAEAALDAADRRGGNRTYYHDGKKCAPVTAMLETMDYLS